MLGDGFFGKPPCETPSMDVVSFGFPLNQHEKGETQVHPPMWCFVLSRKSSKKINGHICPRECWPPNGHINLVVSICPGYHFLFPAFVANLDLDPGRAAKPLSVPWNA